MTLKEHFHGLRKYYNLFVAIFIFCMMTTFSFLATRDMKDSSAASLAGFNPGNIISDATMGNYNSMSVNDIQNFLTSKNRCTNTDYGMYQRLKSAYPHLNWHWDNGHFVCLSEERFGDGETIGSGQTAAEVIYQAAQDYRINPQVLLVLLQKEQSLITDDYPNTRQYRSATGFGCPDTAACSAEYYGFKNQVRQAAKMFRTVLDGGWSNYPAGKTSYIQYNPNRNCGGSNVYIENRATSALYRYTPYQPNVSAINAGYGTGDTCGAYGNRNFYLYFVDWFGSTQYDMWAKLDTPRYFEATQDITRINPSTGQATEDSIINKGTILFYTSKTMNEDGQCLRTEHNTNNDIQACVPQKYLKEIELTYQNLPQDEQYKIINSGGTKTTINTRETEKFNTPLIRKFLKKAEFMGETYYFTEFDANGNTKPINGFKAGELTNTENYSQISQDLIVSQKNTKKIDVKTGQPVVGLDVGTIRHYTAKMSINGKLYYQTEFENANNNAGYLVDGNGLIGYEPIGVGDTKTLRITRTVNRIDPVTGEVYDTLEAGRVIDFSEKIYTNNQWYYRTKHNTIYGLYYAIPASATEEI